MISNFKDILLLEREEDVAGFLGLKVYRDKKRGTFPLHR